MAFTTYCTYILQLVYTYIRHQSTDIVTSADTSQRSQDRFVFVSKPSHASTVCSITGIYVTDRQYVTRMAIFIPMSQRQSVLSQDRSLCPIDMPYCITRQAAMSQRQSVMSQNQPLFPNDILLCHKADHFVTKLAIFVTRPVFLTQERPTGF